LLKTLKLALDDVEDGITRAVARDEAIKRLKAVGVKSPARMVDAALNGSGKERIDSIESPGPMLEAPDPWPDPVVGSLLLDSLKSTFERFLILPDGAAAAMALWVVHSYCIDAFEVSPFLAFTSPVKRCGKTRALETLQLLTLKPLPASNITPAALFRSIEKFKPTLLIDEADTFIKNNDELRGILNAGHRRTFAYTLRNVTIKLPDGGQTIEPMSFSTWGPKAIALIGKLPSTIEDRSIQIRMRRRLKTEKVERFRPEKLADLEELRRKAARWVEDHFEEIQEADPEDLPGLNDRANDNWRPLFAIAEIVGGKWSKIACKAAASIHNTTDEDSSVSVQVLEDIKTVFDNRNAVRIFSEDLVSDLIAMEDRPWPEWRQGKPLTKTGLSRLLKPYGIKPGEIRIGKEHRKGYNREAFEDAFNRYIPPIPPKLNRDTATTRATTGFPPISKRDTPKILSRIENAENPRHDCNVAVSRFEKGVLGGNIQNIEKNEVQPTRPVVEEEPEEIPEQRRKPRGWAKDRVRYIDPDGNEVEL